MSKLLREGDIIEIKAGHSIYAQVPRHFLYSNRKGDFRLDHGRVTVGGENFSYFEGEYLVTKTCRNGGGYGHGPYDVFPDGDHVECQKLDDPSVEISFYQSGSFSAVIRDIEPLRKRIPCGYKDVPYRDREDCLDPLI